MTRTTIGFPPHSVTALLRLEGLAALVAAVTAYWFIGGNWWLFALLLLAPDLSMLGYSAGEKTGARLYNLVHTYTVPATLGAIGWFGGIGWLVPVALTWIAHIGMDRALGYGLKYPGHFKETHLGRMGGNKKAETLANAG
jgi:hypothetical protein